MNDKIIEALIDLNYPVLLGFSLHDKEITWDEYLKKLSEWKMKPRTFLDDTFQKEKKI